MILTPIACFATTEESVKLDPRLLNDQVLLYNDNWLNEHKCYSIHYIDKKFSNYVKQDLPTLERFYQLKIDDSVDTLSTSYTKEQLLSLKNDIELYARIISAKIDCTNYFFKKTEYVAQEAKRLDSLAYVYIIIEKTLDTKPDYTNQSEITKYDAYEVFASGLYIDQVRSIFYIIKDQAVKDMNSTDNETNSFYAPLVIKELVDIVSPIILDRAELIQLHYIKAQAMSFNKSANVFDDNE